MNWQILCSFILIAVGVLIAYFACRASVYKPDPTGQWIGEVLLINSSKKIVVFRDRYRSSGVAEKASQEKAKSLHKYFMRTLPSKRNNTVFRTPGDGDVSITWRTNHVEYVSYLDTLPVDGYMLTASNTIYL